MMPLENSPYQDRLLQTFWDMADIFFFKRKDGSEVEKLFVDYWFGVDFDDENTNGELANNEEELIQLLLSFDIPAEKPFPAYDFLWKGGMTEGYANNAEKCRDYSFAQSEDMYFNGQSTWMYQSDTSMGGFQLYNNAGGNFNNATAQINVYGMDIS